MIRTLCGSNRFLVDRELTTIVQSFVLKHSQMAVQKIDAEEAEISAIREALVNISLFDPIKMVVIKNPSKNKQLVEQIEQLIETIPESTEVVFVNGKLDKRLAFYKTLKKMTDYKEFTEVDSRNLPSWIADVVKDNHGKISGSDARLLAERVGNNQMLLAGEIEKMLIYSPTINRETIELLTEKSLNSSVFDLLDAAFSRNTIKALNIYEELREQKTEAPQIIGMFTWQLYILAIVKTAGQRSSSEIASQAGINPYVLTKSSAIAGRLSIAKLTSMIDQLEDIDVKSKSSDRNADEMLKLYLIELAE